jgi:hypothetical protein
MGRNKDGYHWEISPFGIPTQLGKFGFLAWFIACHCDVPLIDCLVSTGSFQNLLTLSLSAGTQSISREMEANLQALVKNSATMDRLQS